MTKDNASGHQDPTIQRELEQAIFNAMCTIAMQHEKKFLALVKDFLGLTNPKGGRPRKDEEKLHRRKILQDKSVEMLSLGTLPESERKFSRMVAKSICPTASEEDLHKTAKAFRNTIAEMKNDEDSRWAEWWSACQAVSKKQKDMTSSPKK